MRSQSHWSWPYNIWREGEITKLHMPQYSVASGRFLSLHFVGFPPSPSSQTLAATLLPQKRENDSKCFTASIRNRHLQSNDTYLLPIILYLYLHFIVKLHLLTRITYFNSSLDLYPTRRAHTLHTTHHTSGLQPHLGSELASRISLTNQWRLQRPVETWWHTRRNQISSFGETDESIYGGGVSSVDYWQPKCAHQW